MTHDKAAIIAAPTIVILLTAHLSQDTVYGIEPGNIANLAAAAISGLWLYATLAFAGRRVGCVLLLVAALFMATLPLAHMSGAGVGEDIAGLNGAAFFVWTLLAIGVVAPASLLLAIHGLWDLRKSVFSFLLWAAIPLVSGGGLLAYLVYRLG